jgi:hypothetical protein
MPNLLEDVQNAMDGWGTQGTLDPFINIYDVRHTLPATLSAHYNSSQPDMI